VSLVARLSLHLRGSGGGAPSARVSSDTANGSTFNAAFSLSDRAGYQGGGEHRAGQNESFGTGPLCPERDQPGFEKGPTFPERIGRLIVELPIRFEPPACRSGPSKHPPLGRPSACGQPELRL